ncbi:glycosyltransferase family 4 protein [Parapedobacter indicus]|uniref:Glycosyltransferase involved in cell wall bisynthesis n=1 Tax=Parapedobacter indicus TaxID=1477437 RepID=A0A1I3N0H7_9SPHI|nr:glycosyltransferase family 4 protein [Parapedobacter indicus]PPL00838.1 glycosyltransferase involved in cell wall biosynthesis [Parapedobacter indicus]SFJ02727.1 Glycosyltransferase involved in cell wall bisynthesis [Parapedobacter indicus]
MLHIGERGSLGGAESVFRNTILALRTHANHMEHFVACRVTSGLPFEPDVIFMKGDNSLSQLYSIRNFLSLKRGLNKLRPDIVHLHHYGNLSPSIFHAIAFYKCRYPATKVLFSVHTFEYVCSHSAAYDYKKDRRCMDCAQNRYKWRIFTRGCSRLGWKHSFGKGITSLLTAFLSRKGLIDQWITPSRFLKSAMSLRWDVDPTKVSVVYNPVADIHSMPLPMRRKDQMVFFGRLSEEKNIPMLVRAFSQYRMRGGTCRLVIAGEGPMRDALGNLVKQLNLQDSIEITGFLETPALQELLQQSKFAILSSKCYESASMVVLESVICGVMPLVSAHGGMKEMVEWLNCGLQFASEDESDLVSKMEMAVAQYDEWKLGLVAMIDKLKSYVLFEPYAKRLLALYEAYSKTPVLKA